jgi:microcystin-dependent protein
MSEPFLAEIRMVGFNFAPRSWAFCDGQILPINQNQSLYSLLGTVYGGDGRTTFALPDLRGRVPVSVGPDHRQGQKSGEENHVLAVNEMPAHDHVAQATESNATAPSPDGNLLADSAPTELYSGPDNLVAMKEATVSSVGGGQGHNNMQPYQAINFCIALQGLFPSRN